MRWGCGVFTMLRNRCSFLPEYASRNYAMQQPFAVGNTLYIAGSYDDPSIDVDEGGPMSLQSLRLEDGHKQWTFRSEDGFVKALYATKNRVAFVGYQDFISGLDAKTGTLMWRRDSGNWVPALSGHETTVYYGSANTRVHAWDITDGKTLWEYDIPKGSFNYLLDAPARIGQHLFFLSQRGELFILDAELGKPVMHYDTGLVAHVGLATNGHWVVIGDSTGNLHAYNLSLQTAS